MNINYITPSVLTEEEYRELEKFADCHETSPVAVMGIIAIESERRDRQAIWEAPTREEFDNVRMAVQQYVDAGIYRPLERYVWGLESFTLEESES